MSEALRRLHAWITSPTLVFGGHSGHSGHGVENAGLFRDHDDVASGHGGHSGPNPDAVVTTVTTTEDAVVTPKPLKSLAVTGVTGVTAENIEGASVLLTEMLADGPQPEAKVEERAAAQDIRSDILRKAERGLGLRAVQAGGQWWLCPPIVAPSPIASYIAGPAKPGEPCEQCKQSNGDIHIIRNPRNHFNTHTLHAGECARLFYRWGLEERDGYAVLGSARSRRCEYCYEGKGTKRIRHHGTRVTTLHEHCAASYFAHYKPVEYPDLDVDPM